MGRRIPEEEFVFVAGGILEVADIRLLAGGWRRFLLHVKSLRSGKTKMICNRPTIA
jgi:hypothetical protein